MVVGQSPRYISAWCYRFGFFRLSIRSRNEEVEANRVANGVISSHGCSVKGICKSILFKHTKITVYLQKQMLFP